MSQNQIYSNSTHSQKLNSRDLILIEKAWRYLDKEFSKKSDRDNIFTYCSIMNRTLNHKHFHYYIIHIIIMSFKLQYLNLQ